MTFVFHYKSITNNCLTLDYMIKKNSLPPSMNIWKPKWHSQSPNLKDYSNAVLAELLQIKTDQENHLEKSLEKAANMDIHKF